MVSTIFLSTFLIHFTASVSSEPLYILWISSVLQSHSTEKSCVHLLNLNESVSLSVVLEYDGFNATIFDQSVEVDNFYACANFKITQKSSEELAFVTLLVKGNTLKIFERRSVAVTSGETVTFVQTDKPIFKPGDKVEFRIVTLDTKFKPIEDLYPLIILQDPQNNKIFQWQNVTPFQNITQLSFQLTSEPILGDYLMTVNRKSGKEVRHQFTVKKQVLPKFETKVSVPQTLTISDDEFQVHVCAKYTYGQPVQGKVQIQVCREFFSSGNCETDNNAICEQFIAQLKNGCVSQTVNTKVFQLHQFGLYMAYYVTAIVTEIGTGVQISENASISISQLLGTVSFENVDPYYRRGITYVGTLKFSSPNDVPMVNKVLQLELNDKFMGNYTTDENGEAQFYIDTTDVSEPMLSLKASYIRPQTCYRPNWLMPEYVDAYFSVKRFYSRTSSFLKIAPEPKQLKCNEEKMVTVQYSLSREAYADDSKVTFFYLMMVRGALLLNGQVEIRNKAWNGNFSFPINVSADLAPMAVMFVYTLHPTGEIVADSVRFQVDKCFKNKVSLTFSEEQALPGSNVHLHLQAAANSFCALRAVDKSILLLKSEKELTAESVYYLLPNIELYDYFYHGLNLDDEKQVPCIPLKDMFYNGVYYMPVSNFEDGDIRDILRNMGLKAFTNLHYRKPEVCPMERGFPFPRPFLPEAGGYSMMQSFSPRIAADEVQNENHKYVEQAMKERVRTNFPETWIWTLLSVNSSGSANLSFSIPDTITQWEANGFCVNGDVGFGISSTVSLNAFQPFFVELSLPFSLVRNEQCDLVVNVFNYLNSCVEISVQLEASEDYEANINTPQTTSSEVIQAGERKTYVWIVLPKKLGRVNITVVAESRQSSACPHETTEQQNLRWKDTVVRSLLVEPEGIEKETTQSFFICTKDTKISKVIDFDLPNNFIEGTARASFTVVGDLLALAMQNLETVLPMPFGSGEQNIAQLASATYVLDYQKYTEELTEEEKNKAFAFLANGYQKQLFFKHPDGSYSVFLDSNQKGSIWLTALTFKTLERMKDYVFIDEQIQKQTLIWLSSKQKGDGCFESDGKPFSNAWEVGDEEDLSLTAYIVGAFLEAGLNLTFPALRNGLFCLQEAYQSGVTNGYNHAILAYVFAIAGDEEKAESLLKILDQSATKTNNVIHWERAKKPKMEESSSFPPRAPSAEIEKTCYVLLGVISQKIPDLVYASKIVWWLAQQMNSHGGFSSTQATLRYNVPLPKKASGFSLSLDMVKKNSSNAFQTTFDLTVTLKYTGIHKNSNMAIVDVKMLSGFTPVLSSIEELGKHDQVMKTDVNNGHVLFYLENVFDSANSFTFSVEQINLVSNIQPAPVMVYDYYEKDEYALVSYNINSISVPQ
nr:ovostatin homolog isoform X2 [Dasypus novemcinctus]